MPYDHGLELVLMETDSLDVVNLINNKFIHAFHEYSWLLTEILSLMQSQVNTSITHT